MSDQQRELKLVLTLEGKQFNAVLTTNAVSADKLAANVDKITVSKIKAEKVTKAMTGSLTDLNNRLKQATDFLNSLTTSSNKYEAAQKRVAVLSKHVSKATAQNAQDLSKLGAASGTTGFAILNMNRVISDAPFGMIAISNNIEPLIQSMIHLKNEAGGVKGAIATLGKSMIGPLGIMTAVSLVTSALTYYTLHADRAKQESEDLAKKTKELNESVWDLEAGFTDLAEANRLYREELEKTNISEIETQIVALQKKLEQGGNIGVNGFTPFPPGERERLQNEIGRLTEILKTYKKNLADGNPAVNENVRLLKELSEAALQGEKGINKFLLSNKISTNQFKNLANQLKDYENTAFGVLGGRALPKGNVLKAFDTLEIIKKLLPDKKKVVELNAELDKYLDKLSGKQPKEKKKKRDTNPFAVEPAKIDLGGFTDEQNKLFKSLEQNFLANGLEWDSKNQAYAYTIVLNLKEAVTPTKLKTVKRGDNPGKEYVLDSLDELEQKTEQVNRPIMMVMDTMVDGFINAKMSIKEVTKEVGLLIAKMVIMAGLQKLVNTAVLGPLGLLPVGVFHKGGIVGLPTQATFANPKIFTHAQKYHSGGYVGRPAILQDGEVVYTSEQQKNLFKLLSSSFASQMNKSSIPMQPQEIKFVGEMQMNRRRFYSKFERVQSYNNRLTKGFTP